MPRTNPSRGLGPEASGEYRMELRGHMLDPAFVSDHMDEVRKGLKSRGLDHRQGARGDRHAGNRAPAADPGSGGVEAPAEYVGRLGGAGEAAGATTRRPILEANKRRAQQIKQLSLQLDSVAHQRDHALLLAAEPAPRHRSGREGLGGQLEVRRHGEPRTFDFEPQSALGYRTGARHPRLRTGRRGWPVLAFRCSAARARGSSAR